MASSTQPTPTIAQIRIENTNLCGYACNMCPREKMSRQAGVMPVSDLEIALDRVEEYLVHTGQSPNYKRAIHLHGFGEPLLDKLLPERVAVCRNKWPESKPLFYSTLGVKVAPDYFKSLLGNGLVYVSVSFYGFQAETYRDLHGVGMYQVAYDNLLRLAELNDSMGRPCRIGLQLLAPWTTDRLKTDDAERAGFDRLWSIVKPLGVELKYLGLHNFSDGRDYHYRPAPNKMCSVFNGGKRSHILQVTWNLRIIPCCFDYNASMVWGDLRTQSLAEIYDGEPYAKLVAAHHQGKLEDYPACLNCDMR